MKSKVISYVLSAIAYFGVLLGIPFAKDVDTYVLGLPFLLFYMVLWILLGSAIMYLAHILNPDTLVKE